MKKLISLSLTALMILATFSGCAISKTDDGSNLIELSDSKITCDGKTVTNENSEAVYTSNDIVYYQNLDTYESGNKYGEGAEADKHTKEEANANTVLNITKAGTYRISGTLSKGQIKVDLGEDAKADENAVVTLILDNADITCDVAPAILFNNVYECDKDASTDNAKSDVDTQKAGANIIIADDSTNTVRGSHVAKIYKDNSEEKKLCKQDGAVYSYMSMNVNAEEKSNGILNIFADNEGLDTELHLTINGGNINIWADNDGINTNEDGISVTTINNGILHIVAGLGEEGDGIDSNGWLVINGGTVISSANPKADAGLDSDMGSYINGGTVIALGSTMDWAESDSKQVTMNLQFAELKNADDAIIVTDTDGKAIFAYNPSGDELLGENARQYQGAIISSPSFKADETYNVYVGGTISGNCNLGIYTEITDYENAVKQSYTGTDVRGGFGGAKPQGEKPQGEIPTGEMPSMENQPSEKPDESFNPTRLDDGQTPPEKPSGENGTPPERPTGENAENMTPPQMPNGENEQQITKGEASEEFYMQDMVNFFSGVSDITK